MALTQLQAALVKAQNHAIGTRVLVEIENAFDVVDIVALAPEDMTEDEARAVILSASLETEDRSELSQTLFEKGFAVFDKFTTVQRK